MGSQKEFCIAPAGDDWWYYLVFAILLFVGTKWMWRTYLKLRTKEKSLKHLPWATTPAYDDQGRLPSAWEMTKSTKRVFLFALIVLSIYSALNEILPFFLCP